MRCRMEPKPRRAAWIGALLVCVTLAAACSTASTSAPEHTDGHAKKAAHLREVMKTFDASVRHDVATEVDSFGRQEGVFPDMTDAAEALEQSAVELSSHPPKNLPAIDREDFKVLARSLASAAADLRLAAAHNDAGAVESTTKKLGTACRDCHDRYRPGSPGVPDAFR